MILPLQRIGRAGLLLALFAPSAFAQEAVGGGAGQVTLAEVEAYEAAALRFRARMNEFALDARGIVDQLEREEREKVAFSYDTLITGLNDKDKELRAETIARFEGFLGKYPSTEYSPHVMFRLAELYYELSVEDYYVERADYDRMFENLTDEQIFAMEIPDPPRVDQTRSIQLYERILANHPDYEFIPGTLYMLGYSYSNDNSQEALLPEAEERFLGYFKRLVAEHPDSPVAVSGNWGLGLHYFDNNEVEVALPYFNASLAGAEPGSDMYQNTAYMLAWSHYKLSDYNKAMALFTELLDISEEVFLNSGKQAAVRPEAIEYSAYAIADIADRSNIVFSDPGWRSGATEADLMLANLLTDLGLGVRPVSPIEVHNAWFTKVGRRDFELDIMKKQADVLYGYARYEDTIATYQYIQRTWPNEPENPRYQVEIARIYGRSLGDDAGAQATMAALAERYGEGSAWALANRNNPDALNEARNYIETSLFDVAKSLHQRAQNTGDPDTFSEAADRYAEYLEQFPFADTYFEASWLHADALFQSGRYREAIVQDEQLIKVGGHDYVELALYQRFYAWYKILGEEYGGPDKLPEGAVVEKTVPTADGGERKVYTLSADHLAFIAAADAVRSRPFENPDVAEVRDQNLSALYYVPAQILYHHNRFEEARPRLEELIATYPKTDDASKAATLVVNSYVADNDLVKVVEKSSEYRLKQLGEDPAKKASQTANFKNLEEGGKFKLALALKESGQLIEAAEAFLAFMDEFPNSDKVHLALYNAANTYEVAGKAERANELFEQYIKTWPKGEYAEGLYWRIASNYASILELDQAIEYYERLASYYPKNVDAAAALYMAGFLKIGKGDFKGAATNFEYYVKKYPEQPDAEQVYWLAGEQWQKVSDRDAFGFYTRYLRDFPDTNPDHVIEVKHWMATYYEAEGNKRKADDAWADVIATFNDFAAAGRPIGAKGRNLAAEAAFRDLKAIYDAYIIVQYPKGEEALVQYLGLDPEYDGGKAVELGELEQRTLQMVQTYQDFEYSSGALYLAGSAYLAYSDMLYNAPCPEKFNEDQCMFYQGIIGEKVQGPQTKGLDRLNGNLKKAEDAKRSSVWIDRTIERLNEFDPSLYPLEKPESRGAATAQVIPSSGPLDMPEPETAAATEEQ